MMKGFWHGAALLAGLLAAAPGYALPPLQMFVDVTPPGGVLRPPPGSYAGPVVIRRPLTLEGEGRITIDGGGRGTVLSVTADHVTVRGLRLTHSGESHDTVDAGILVAGNDNLIEDNTIDDALFGIHLRQARRNTVRGNRIGSKPSEVNMRGDGLRLWYSSDNLIEGNTLHEVRDVLLINSPDNRVIGNDIRRSGVGMQLVYAPGNLLEDNTIDANTTGIVVVYSDDNTLRGNRMRHLRSASGAGLAVKDSSGVVAEDNEILHCAVGVQSNSPTHPENILELKNNRLAYNDVAMYFYGEKGGHIIHGNRFEHNLQDIAVSAPTSARANDWRGNSWDNYQGFDRDGDGVGDQPHEIHLYADRIWMDRPMTRFFRGSPMLDLVDFIERLAPFSDPPLVLRDPAPRVR
ncbi:MAG: nitrous oxide reductase family maturation protein NosD [Gammaproteobacteria bacterium HGW-Gammaproteobacteria-1]|jgi:nitrous oxidase accessory protein|nr:MAG: nitrous oxide reductase family maturation protein NosD [Gammaproteobacteria bacterium HGW-Gammaproteobacteria-1]